MNNLLFRILLWGACTVAGGTITMLIYKRDFSEYTKITSLMLVCGMLLVIIALILNQRRTIDKKY